jgi:pantoate--beta-alanine ligase
MTDVVATVAEFRARCDAARAVGRSVGLVPTMGFLHAGHRSLMRAARAADGFVAVTIYVNPLQFGANEDLGTYPRDLTGDVAACEAEGVDVVFAPTDAEMYPAGAPATRVIVAGITEPMCGTHRPGHFDGVTTVVTKLFAITGPCRAYFGRKDAQQLAVIERMSADLNLPVDVVGCPLVREPDGLALSSRNAYLTDSQRAVAPGVFAALRAAARAVEAGERDPQAVAGIVRSGLAGIDGATPQYVEVRDAHSLAPVEHLDGEVLIAVAVHLGATRLIDNVRVSVDGPSVHADLGVGWTGTGGAEPPSP